MHLDFSEIMRNITSHFGKNLSTKTKSVNTGLKSKAELRSTAAYEKPQRYPTMLRRYLGLAGCIKSS